MNFVTLQDLTAIDGISVLSDKPFPSVRNFRSTISLLGDMRQGIVKSVRRRVVSTNQVEMR